MNDAASPAPDGPPPRPARWEHEHAVRDGAHHPIWPASSASADTKCGRAEIERMIPHRDPFLLIDSIAEIDRDSQRIRGSRLISRADPVFAGHFPGQPIYPGVLLVEAIGQLGLCLVHALSELPSEAVRAVRIHHAVFLREVKPDQQVEIVAQLMRADDFTATCRGQVLHEGAICAFAILEVFLG